MESNSKIELNENFFAFVKKHLGEDAMRLRLKKFSDIDFPIELAITQIEARGRRLERKIPLWTANERIVFPSILSTEQCSSQETAQYKANLVVGQSLCDLTGGLGIDTFFMAQQVKEAVYIEQNTLYSQCARHNFDELGAQHISVVNSDCNTFLTQSTQTFDTIYIDPARRGKSQERLFALADCEPNVLAMMPTLLKRCKRLIIKLSPMVDITMLRQELACDNTIHIVSLNNECKEILAVIDTDKETAETTKCDITCSVITRSKGVQTYKFDPMAEQNAVQTIANDLKRYLYEPDTAILKAGMFKSVCQRFGVEKLHKNSHLYTSQNLVAEFPGRSFTVNEVLPFSSRLCKEFAKQYKCCNIATRNFPLSAVELRKKLKCGDGGDIYLFATTIGNNEHILIMCNKS